MSNCKKLYPPRGEKRTNGEAKRRFRTASTSVRDILEELFFDETLGQFWTTAFLRISSSLYPCYSALCRNEFAYASSDKLVYIRQFSDRGAEMTLSAVLQGHEAEVTQVRTLQSRLVARFLSVLAFIPMVYSGYGFSFYEHASRNDFQHVSFAS